jgi:uncharacterized membrane-anchored protein
VIVEKPAPGFDITEIRVPKGYRGEKEIMKFYRALPLLMGALLFASAPVTASKPAAEPSAAEAEAAMDAELEKIEKDLHPQFGRISLLGAKAALNIGSRYYFLSAEETRKILVDAWGNPPDAATGVLGMVFPAGKSFRDSSWGAVVQYEETGHVKDDDAASQDFDQVLADMKQAVESGNPDVVAQGYAAKHLIGWAQPPTYDSRSKTLIWARNIKFEGTETNTLNYDVRKLGRTGVLSLNMVDSMPNLPAVKAAAVGLGETVSFDPGSAYADYNSSTDVTAEYGLSGLVAAGAGLLVAKKLGIIGILLLVLKKGLFVFLAAAAGLGLWFKRKFGGGYRPDEELEEEQPDELPRDDRHA